MDGDCDLEPFMPEVELSPRFVRNDSNPVFCLPERSVGNRGFFGDGPALELDREGGVGECGRLTAGGAVEVAAVTESMGGESKGDETMMSDSKSSSVSVDFVDPKEKNPSIPRCPPSRRSKPVKDRAICAWPLATSLTL